ncbi:MAG: hypothetical protein PHU12_04000 [Candidatus Aenigmarchaeota archaeon]|nr:hypothetical protein [Candidatus Aenigmarchaeota archaeon]
MGKLKTRIETHRMYHISGCHKEIRCPKNLVRFNTGNSKEHEMMKASVCFDLQKSGSEFITEACHNGDIIDIVNLDTGEEIEVVNTHGFEKAVTNGRRVVKV